MVIAYRDDLLSPAAPEKFWVCTICRKSWHYEQFEDRLCANHSRITVLDQLDAIIDARDADLSAEGITPPEGEQ